MKNSIFLGCTIPSRAMNYEMSTRKVAEALGIDLIDVDYGCCGFPIGQINGVKALALASKNLQIANEKKVNILTLCSACAEMLTKTQVSLSESEDLRKKVNSILKKSLGIEYEKGVIVKHFARFLFEDFGVKRLKDMIKRPLENLKIAAHYGCHYVRPSEIYEGFDDPERPETLDMLIEATGAQKLEYQGKMACCGGEVSGIEEKVSTEMTKNKLLNILETEADAMVLICPFCSIMYDKQQNNILENEGKKSRIPIIYYPQLLGLALGIDKNELGFELNAIDVQEVLEKIGV